MTSLKEQLGPLSGLNIKRVENCISNARAATIFKCRKPVLLKGVQAETRLLCYSPGCARVQRKDPTESHVEASRWAVT